MNSREEKQLQMANVTLKVMDDHESIWNANAAIVRYKAEMKEMLEELAERREDTVESSIAITTQKAELKKNIAMKAYVVAAGLSAYAEEVNNERLRQIADFTESKIFKINDINFVPAVMPLITESRSLLTTAPTEGSEAEPKFADQGITEDLLADIHQMIQKYEPLVGSPRHTIIGTSLKNKEISEILDDLMELLDKKLDKSMAQYKITEPTFHEAYTRARNIVG